MNRNVVYLNLDNERAYQNKRWAGLDTRNSVADFLCYMQRYLNEAVAKNNPDLDKPSLTAICKLTAIGVACMEKFGCGDPR